jgi:hypothetical protein
MTSVGDKVDDTLVLSGLTLVILGGTVGNMFKIVDGDDSIVAEGVVEAVAQNIDLLGGNQIRVDGLRYATEPGGGSILLARLR